MKKRKTGKSSSKDESLALVTAMTKLVERLEVLEKKTDSLTGRVGSLPHEIKQFLANLHAPQKPSPSPAGISPHGTLREKILYQAVCADCHKECKVPFRPKEGREVYCPECWAIRKAGHVPRDPTERIKPLHPPKKIIPASEQLAKAALSVRKPGKAKKKPSKPSKKKKK